MQRFFSSLLALLLVLAGGLPSTGLADNKNSTIDVTLEELNAELDIREQMMTSQKPMLEGIRARYEEEREKIDSNLKEVSVILYSLDLDNMFTLAFFSKKVAELKQEYLQKQFPFEKTNKFISKETAQLSNFKTSLENIPMDVLSEKSHQTQLNAIGRCNKLINTMEDIQKDLKEDEYKRNILTAAIDSVNDYAKNQLDDMLEELFTEPAHTYKSFYVYWIAFSGAIQKYYFPSREASERTRNFQTIWFRITAFLVGSYMLSFGVFYLLLKQKKLKQQLSNKIPFYIFAGTLALLAFFLFFSRYFQPIGLIISTIDIAFEFMILTVFVILALTVRLEKEQISTGIKFYLPSLLLCMFFILLRMCMVPNIAVDFLLPFAFPVAVLFQFIVLVKYKNKLTRIDRGLGNTSLALFIISTIMCWKGYCFPSFLINLIWIMLVSSLLVLMAIRTLLHQYQEKRSTRKENANKLLGPFISKLLVPLLSVLLIIFSCLWPASIFDISHIITGWTSSHYKIPNIVSYLSIDNVIRILIWSIILNYIIFVAKTIVTEIYQRDDETETAATYVMLGRLLLWTAFVLICLAYLGANFNGILVVLGGMSMGIGFALKDTIDNAFCGLSLIFGRLKQGDIVECDGIRGKVSSIGLRTTFIETLDGSIIGFLNNQLFNKNFRNLTQNHLYESVKVEIGVSYGTNIQQAREIILEAVRQVDNLPRSRTINVVLDSFGDNSVNLGVWVWVPVRLKPATLSKVRECIYMAFNDNGISIPFPQQDIYIKELPHQNSSAEEK